SELMLEKAKKRVDELGLKNVEGLAVMDAEKLEFPDDSFDVVMAQYVVTAVPNPEQALDEFARVLRPGGELIILTRVSADAGMRRFIEQRLQPVLRNEQPSATASSRRCKPSHVNMMMSHAGHRISIDTNPKEFGGRE